MRKRSSILMNAYEQKAMVYEMAMDRVSAIISAKLSRRGQPAAGVLEKVRRCHEYVGSVLAETALWWFWPGRLWLRPRTGSSTTFKVGRQASVSIINQYGPISVKPARGQPRIVMPPLYSDKVEVDQNQSGNHVDVVSHLLPGADANNPDEWTTKFWFRPTPA